MKEKIFQMLKKQRGENSNVSDRSLEDLATTMSQYITTDEQLEDADFKPMIDSLDGNIRKTSADATKAEKEQGDSALAKLQKELDDARKLVESQKKQKETPEVNDVPNEQVEELKELVNTLKGQVDGFTAKELAGKRAAEMKAILKDTPDAFKSTIMAAFESTKFEDDAAFETYKNTTKEGVSKHIQELKEAGLPTVTPASKTHKDQETGQTSILQKAHAIVDKSKQKK